ncbi:hypothetical protein N7495_002098 [Penicillium taxi]|uniref:uncharacterized protein n=1 Tax=Penicillium taxi TaxID=168475 RepID=UPI002545495C|nr:uncharacterized protein N7495_002098 [Penicillium taxi]KAJ5901570.1 hypothetical protein N7495_002098 [Penicillium taxi]
MSPPVTPQRPSKAGGDTQSPTRILAIGKPLAVHDTNTVRARVRNWQQQGGGVITVNDGVCDEESGDVIEEITPKAKPKPKVRVEKTKFGVPVQVRKRSNSTPKKRVISDEHWRKNRSNTHMTTRNLPMPKRINEYTTNEGSPRRKRHDKNDLSPPRSSEGGSSRSSARDVTEIITIIRKPESVADSDLLTDLSKVPDNMKRRSPPPEDIDWTKSEADFSELSRRRARGPAKQPPKSGIFAHVLDESRKMFTRPEAEPPKPQPTQPSGHKVESWLSETSDPFVDHDTKSVMPVPLDIKSAKARRSRRLADEETTSSIVSDSESRPSRSHSRKSKSRSPKEKSRKSSDSKPTRADTGKKSPKSAAAKTSHDKLYEESIATSDGSEVSGNNAPVPLGIKRPFPSTGYHRLSTIVSIETLSSHQGTTLSAADNIVTVEPGQIDEEAAEGEDQFDPNSLPAVSSQLKRRLTTHKDLMSVLSVPASRSRSIRSNRSTRSNKSRLANATVADILSELVLDEAKYMRELKTLVGGVIPVLLTCVLSRSDSAIAAGLFNPSLDPKDDLNFSKPIVNMGVAIERLKALHKRIPQNNADALLTWAHGAQRVYREYLKAWRLGFKDVIVNLAPLEEDQANNADTKSLDEGMERDQNGDVIDSDGEKVDVAYLLKRPLVRLKYLSKSFKGINMLQPSTKAEEISNSYQDLVIEARKRARDERARLEDESAASIDSTRARDPMTLGVLRDVKVDRTRRVRARDFFNLSLYHSSGQLVDCRAELLYRDNASGNGPGGDLMICEIDHADRWLLFPPIDVRCVSARNGDSKGEIVIMLRSAPEDEKYWQELISLRIDDFDIGVEWVQLLGSDPNPPTLCRSQSFISRAKQHRSRRSIDSPPRVLPIDVDIPIGERRLSLGSKEHYSESSTVSSSATETRSSLYSTATRETDYTTGSSDIYEKQSRTGLSSLPSIATPEKTSGLKRSKAKRISRYGESPSSDPATPKPLVIEKENEDLPSGRFYGEESDSGQDSSYRPKTPQKTPQTPQQHEYHEPESPRVSTTPSARLPLIPKIRSSSSQTHISALTSNVTDEEEYPPLKCLPEPEPETRRSRRRKSRRKSGKEDAPPPPPHRLPSSGAGKLSNSNTPVLSPSGLRLKRRGSSPLKHEYEPSTASDSYSESDSDASTVRHYTYSSSEYSRSEFDSDESYSSASDDDLDLPKPRPFAAASSDASSLSPSNSASQGGYRTVPLQPTKSSTAIASLFAWSDKGTWDSLLPDECSISISPGLIEAFQLNADSNKASPRSSRPLISMELTPLVPIRRGTAIDISIRSPPTSRSTIMTNNNIMFRSRNPDECDTLYSLINQARINNPTYIALQNARGSFKETQLPAFEPATKSGGSWFGFPRRRKSYRASSSPRSLADGSESSVGSVSTAFSALKRFGGASKMFNISRSTVTSRAGRAESIYSGEDDASHPPSPPTRIGGIADIKGADGIGLSNSKIRIYLRESASKWRDMGAARLTIMPAPSSQTSSRPGTAVSGRSSSSGHGDLSGTSPPSSGAATPGSEKRIIIRGKTRGEVLLDACLPESRFERVARTGIAVSVHEENNEGGSPAKKEGGVTTSCQRIYMIQMKSEVEAAYTFGLVGKQRY